MTASAVARGRLEQHIAVTLAAGRVLVPTKKWPIRLFRIVVIKQALARWFVTRFAHRPQGALVHVIFQVTIHTMVPFALRRGKIALGMATLARYIAVVANQRKFGLGRMVKTACIPFSTCVTVGAVAA